jgi:predicted O-methyltransferase YrrM
MTNMNTIETEQCRLDIESSYKEHNLAQTLYDYVRQSKPQTIVEFGCLYGYSTVAMALALKKNGTGKIFCYDLWEDYPYKHTTQSTTLQNLKRYGVEDYVELVHGDYYAWLQAPTNFDLLHLDISNDGLVIQKTYDSLTNQLRAGSVVLFEGGSEERDRVEWMLNYNKQPIQSTKQSTGYEILNNSFPSISVLKYE